MPVKPRDIVGLSSEINPHLRKIKTLIGCGRFLNLQEILRPADEQQFEVLAANAVVPEMLYAALDEAFDCNSPLIIEVAESQVGYALPGWDYKDKLTRFMDLTVRAVATRVAKHNRLMPICMHIDHLQKDPALAYAAAEAGFVPLTVFSSTICP